MKKLFLFFLVFTIFYSSNILGKDKEASRLHNLKALKLLKKKNYEDAIREFQIAFFLYPNSKPLINIAKTYELLKRLDLALEYYKMALEYSVDPAEKEKLNKKISELRQYLLQRMVYLSINIIGDLKAQAYLYKIGEKKPSKECLTPCKIWIKTGYYKLRIVKKGYEMVEKNLKISGNGVLIKTYPMKKIREIGILDVKSMPDGAEVYINDTFKGKAPLTLELMPGKYNIKIAAKGYAPWEKTVTISPGETEHFYVFLETLEEVLLKGGTIKQKEHKKVVTKKENKNIKKISTEKIKYKEKVIIKRVGKTKIPKFLKWMFLSVGVAALGSGGYLNYLAINKVEDANSLKPTTPNYSERFMSLYNDGKNFEKTSYMLYGVGSLSLITGTVLYFLEK